MNYSIKDTTFLLCVLLSSISLHSADSTVASDAPYGSYEHKAQHCEGLAKKILLNFVIKKQTNLVVSADVTTSAELLRIIDEAKDHICGLKLHYDIITDFTPAVRDQLVELAKKHEFFIIVDRKFADIGNTARLQYTKGQYQIATWADLVTAHAIAGPGMLAAMKQTVDTQQRGVLLIAEMSTKGALTDQAYKEKALSVAREHKDFVTGFITRSPGMAEEANFLRFTPGISIVTQSAADQQYLTPEKAFGEHGTDIAIVGRGIYEKRGAINEMAQRYKKACWDAYLRNIELEQALSKCVLPIASFI